MLDSSDGSEDVIVVAEEKMKGVEKPHTQVSPAQVCVGYIKSIFSMTIMKCGKLIEIVSAR